MGRKIIIKELTNKQKELVQKAWSLGYNDKVISAHPKINCEYLAVYYFRREMGISPQTITNNRLDAWKRAIESAGDADAMIEKLAESYKVQPYSIKLMLWNKRSFSLRKIQAENNKRIDAERKAKYKESENPFAV